MTIREQVTQELEGLNEAELEQVAEFLQYLRFRARIKATEIVDEPRLAALYAEFADEDREMAEEGMVDYAKGLVEEDFL